MNQRSMMNLGDHIRREKNIAFFDWDSDITVVKYVIPLGYTDTIQKNGYAHLIEHMIIQTNGGYLTGLEKRGIQFNAETKDSKTEFFFIDLQGNLLIQEMKSGRLDGIFETAFTESALEIEKGTITQEYLLLCSRMDAREVGAMIGTPEEIVSFELKKAERIRGAGYREYHTLVFADPEGLQPDGSKRKEVFDPANWLNRIGFTAIDRGKKEIRLELQKGICAELLVYCLRILFCDKIRDYGLQIRWVGERIEIKITGNTQRFSEVFRYKDHAYHYYRLRLASFKFLCNEVTYVTEHQLELFDLETIYLEGRWEEQLCEKIDS